MDWLVGIYLGIGVLKTLGRCTNANPAPCPDWVVGMTRPFSRLRSERLVAGVFLVALTIGTAAHAACFQVDGMQIPQLKSALSDAKAVLGNDPSQRISPLQSIYQRIAVAAGIRPALLVCNDPIYNAEALGRPDFGFIVFYTPLLELINNNVDELAFVMAHEFSHLGLDHPMQRATAHQNIANWARWIANDRYKRTGQPTEARKQAVDFWDAESTKFTRKQEREADDKGFSIAVTLAKFGSDGAKSFWKKMSKFPPSDRPAYLDDHPSTPERLERADLQAVNQGYINSAAALLERNDWPRLALLVDPWLRDVPESGAGWYYNGLVLIRQNKAQAEITQVFETSVSYYLGSESLGPRSQEDQDEVQNAWVYLCVALFDEGFKIESANCSRRILYAEWKDTFIAMTFRGVFLVGGDERVAKTEFWIAREKSGSKLITSDKSIAASRGPLHTFPPPWKAIRFPAIPGQ